MKIFDHKIEKYKRKMWLSSKDYSMAIQLTNSVIAKIEPKNSNVKMFKKPKKIKESKYSEPKNY